MIIFCSIIYTVYTIITQDFQILINEDLYLYYKYLVCDAFIYILLCLYTNAKRINTITTGKTYKRQFNIIVLVSTIALSILTMLLGSSVMEQQSALPIVFSLIIIIIFLCLSTYRHLTATLEEAALDKIQLEKVRLEEAYYKNVEASLEQLSKLKHDFKNHLIVLDGYAKTHSYEELSSYIEKITEDVTASSALKTASPLLDSILNAKMRDADIADVKFTYELDYKKIYIDDYSFITIVGNILDNAISAAAKMADGFVNFRVIQEDSSLLISCHNNHCEQIQKKKGRFLSSKPSDTVPHGIGLTNVSHAVDTKNGHMDIDYTEQDFRIRIVLPNYE